MAPLVPYLAVLLGLFVVDNVWVAALGYHLGMAGVLAGARGWGQARRLRVGGSVGLAVGLVGGGVLCGVLLHQLWAPLGIPRGLDAALAPLGLTAVTWPAFMLYFCVVNPWLEEVYWRGYLGTPARGPVWNDLLFAGYHVLVLSRFLPWPPLFLALGSVLLAGWGWRQLARVHPGLCLPAVSHLAVDAAVIYAIYRHVGG
jgi:hypothetical protein